MPYMILGDLDTAPAVYSAPPFVTNPVLLSAIAASRPLLSRAWRTLQVSYGVAAIVAALGVAGVMALSGSVSPGRDAEPTVQSAASLPEYTRHVVYVVGSQREADYLRAFGVPDAGPHGLVPPARITVVVSDGSDVLPPEKVLQGQSSGASAPEVVDLRRH